MILRGNPSCMVFQEKRPWGIFLWTKTLVWSGFDSSSTVRYEHQTHTHTYWLTAAQRLTHYQSKCTIYKKRHSGQFWKKTECKLSNDERAVESAILFSSEGWKRKGSEWHFDVMVCFSALLFFSSCPCKVCSDILSPFPPDQVRDAGRVLREWHSRGKRQICTAITVMTSPVTRWHLDIAWPHVT